SAGVAGPRRGPRSRSGADEPRRVRVEPPADIIRALLRKALGARGGIAGLLRPAPADGERATGFGEGETGKAIPEGTVPEALTAKRFVFPRFRSIRNPWPTGNDTAPAGPLLWAPPGPCRFSCRPRAANRMALLILIRECGRRPRSASLTPAGGDVRRGLL